LRPLLLLIASAAILASSTHCRAQQTPSIVIAPPSIKGVLTDTITANIANELEQAFVQHGWRVVGLSEALSLSVSTPGPCSNNTCALAYAQAAQVDAALQLSMFAHSTLTFSLALVQPPGDAFVHHGTLADPYHPAAVIATAADDLLVQHARGPGPWLIVKGSPLDAAVRLDGEVIGVLPLRKRIAGGEHVLVVSANAHADHNDTVWIDNVAGAVKEVHVELKPVEEARPITTRAFQRHWADWVVGGALGAGGIAYAGLGLTHYTESSDCLDSSNGVCVRRAKPGALAATQLGVGLAAAAAGGLIVWRAPFGRRQSHVAPTVSATEARIDLHMEF